MADFTIYPQRVRQTAGTIGNYSRKLSSYKQKIHDAKASLNTLSSMAGVRIVLGTLETRASHHAGTLFSEDAFTAVINEINENYDSDAVVTFALQRDGLTPSAQENHIMAYLKDHGMDTNNISYETKSSMSASALQNNLNEGKVTSVLILSGTEMYSDSEGTTELDGGHYVTITGIADDGKYIVSSWGKQYYIDPAQADVANYQVININF